MFPIVSVVLPVYNGQAFIKKAIESVFNQQVPFELIIIDDNSTDNTRMILSEFLDSNNNCIQYIKNSENIGVAQSRNKGVSLAKGKYIAFLDADDWWDKNKLQKQITLLEKHNYVLCCTARELVDKDGNSMNHIISVNKIITYKALLHHNCISCSSVLVLKSIMEYFPMEHEDSHEDYITWLKILKQYKFACAINEPLLKYRVSNTGKSGSKWNSAKMTLKVYRYSGLNWYLSFYYFCWYVYYGLKKHAYLLRTYL